MRRATSSPGPARRPSRSEADALLHALRENGRLLAELASRSGAAPLAPPGDGRTVRCPADVAAYLTPEMGGLEQEQLRVVLLNARNRIKRVALMYQGTANCAHVRLAECFREAVREGAAAIVLVHNHPSGETQASPEDVQLTADAARVGELLGVDVLDHIILARDAFTSLRAAGLFTPGSAPIEAAGDRRSGPTTRWPGSAAPTRWDAPAHRRDPAPRRDRHAV